MGSDSRLTSTTITTAEVVSLATTVEETNSYERYNKCVKEAVVPKGKILELDPLEKEKEYNDKKLPAS